MRGNTPTWRSGNGVGNSSGIGTGSRGQARNISPHSADECTRKSQTGACLPTSNSASTNDADSVKVIVSVPCEENKDQNEDVEGHALSPGCKYFREKSSYGIACTRIVNGQPQILLMCKRYTYAYNAFVHGRYNSCDNAAIMKMFNEMTVDEKINLYSMNFQQIWHRIYLNSKHRRMVYFSAKSKFESTFAVDDGVRLRRMIGKSRSAKCIWEIPKGRRNRAECDISAAVRELREETGVPKSAYKLDQDVVFTQDYIDEGVRYRNYYFFAYTPHHVSPRIDMGSEEQLKEVSAVQWMDIRQVREADTVGYLAPLVEGVFRLLKSRSKKRLI